MSTTSTASVRLLSGEREPVRVASTGNVTPLSGLKTIDGIDLAVGDRLLLKDQTDARENGIYAASVGVWYRASDARSPRAINAGVTVAVQEGATNQGRTYEFATRLASIGIDPITLSFKLPSDLGDQVGDVLAAATVVTGSAAQVAADREVVEGLAFDAKGFASTASAAAGTATGAASTAQTSAGQAMSAANTASTNASAAVAARTAAESAAGANLANAASRAAAILTTIPASVGYVRTAGYTTAGDGGGALYKRVGSQPAHAGKFQSTDGAWWEIVAEAISPAMVGGSIQTAVDVAFALGLKTVALQGSYTITAPIYIRPGIRLWSAPGAAAIGQGNGAGLNCLVDFHTYLAHGASVDGITLDMNRAGNADNTGHAVVLCIGNVDDPRVINCNIINGTGHGILFQETMRPVIEGNKVENCFVSGIYVRGVSRTAQNNALIRKNRVTRWGQHAIVTWNVQGSRIIENDCIGYSQKTTVHIDDNLIVWVSGPNFSTVRPGEFVIGIHSGGYFEALILSKQGNTQLTVNYVIGDYFNVPCVIGNGDVISVSGTRDDLVQGNTVVGGASLGISLFSTAESSQDRCKVIGNSVLGTMASGFSLQVANASYSVRDNAFIGNTATDTGVGGSAMDADFRSGMTAILGNNGKRNIINSNQWLSYGAGMVDGLRVGANTGGILVGANTSLGVTEGITGGATIALSNWGAGAAIFNLFVHGDAIFFTVTSGTAPAANPTITITHNVLPLRRKRPTLQMTSAPATLLPCFTFYPDPDNSSVFTVVGTPAGSAAYQFVVRL